MDPEDESSYDDDQGQDPEQDEQECDNTSQYNEDAGLRPERSVLHFYRETKQPLTVLQHKALKPVYKSTKTNFIVRK
jgi:hypothetical protein